MERWGNMISIKKKVARAVAGISIAAMCGTLAITVPNIAVGQDTSTNNSSISASQNIDTSEGLNLGTGARATSTVYINQVGVKEEALAAVKKWRQDALDTNVRWDVNGEEKTVADALTAYGISRDEYLNPKWSYAMERIAIQRIAEVMSANLGHTRPNGGTPWTLLYNGTSSETEDLSWGDTTVTEAIDHWATEKEYWVNKTPGKVTGHYTSLINPLLKSYGFAGANHYRWSGEALHRVDSNESATNWSGDLTFTIPMAVSHFQSVGVSNPINLSVGQSQEINMNETFPGSEYDYGNDTQLQYIISLKSADSDIATVDDNTITGMKPGSTTITITSGDQSRDITVNVVGAKVTEVTNPDDITVSSGTAESELGLPKTVNAKLNNGTNQDVAVKWADLTAEQKATLAARDGGTIKLSGTVDGWDKPVTLTITVTKATVVSADIADADKNVTTESGTKPTLAKQGTVTWSNGDTEQADVQWNDIDAAQYSARDGGQFTVTGKLAGKSVSVQVTVKPATVTKVANVDPVTTEAKVAPKLPSTVKVTWSNGDTTDETVTWNITAEDYAKRGSKEISGTVLSGTNQQTVKTTLTVTAHITKVTDPDTVTTPSGTDPKNQLPKQVTVTYSDDETAQADVTWDASTKAQYTQTKGGSYKLSGKVAGTDLPATITVNVTAATLDTVDNPADITVASGTKPEELKLPETVVAHYSDGTTAPVQVQWNALTDDQKATLADKKDGQFTVQGTAEGKDVTLTVKVTPASITSVVAPTGITVESGTAADALPLPSTVKVQWSNGTESDATVTWNALTDEQKAILASRDGGDFTLGGDVDGYTKPKQRLFKRALAAITGSTTTADDVTIDVHVKPATAQTATLAQGDDQVTTASGTAPTLPAKATVTWSNGDTTQEPVSWNAVDKTQYSARQGGAFEVAGTAQGLPVTTTVTVKPATVVSVKPQADSVETTVGSAPAKLPAATVTWSNGDSETKMPAWDTIADTSVAQAGEFTEKGTVTIDGTDHEVSVKVIVNAKEEPKPDDNKPTDQQPTDDQKPDDQQQSQNPEQKPADQSESADKYGTLAATGAAIAAIAVLAVLALVVGVVLRVRSSKSTATTQAQHTEE